MDIQSRPYRDARDMARMRQLLVSGTQAHIPASYAHPGVIDLATHFPPDALANRRDIVLWESAGEDRAELEAFAIFLRYEGSFDLFVSPGLYGTPSHERVMDTYLIWAEEKARALGLKQLWPFWAMAYDKVLENLLHARGFIVVQSDPPVPLYERALDTLPIIPLPEGYTVQGVHNLDEGRLRARVTHGAFRPNDDWDAYWSVYAQFIGSTVYDGERDLFVRSPDGRGASACSLWFDPLNAVGLFEPVATHPDFQNKGLGKVVMAEGLRRMQDAGMRRAIVGFDPNNEVARALYTSMGFQASCYFMVAQKNL